MEPQKVVAGVASFVQRKIIGVFLFAGAFTGLISAELLTRALSHSETYYQEHTPPRLLGAIFALIFSYAILRIIIWLIRWTKSEDSLVRASIDTPKVKDRDVVGLVCYMPFIMFIICVIVAFIPQ